MDPARDTPKPVLFYCLASAGMGHATRAEPALEHLSQRFDVHVFCGGPALVWLGRKFPNLHRIHRVRQAFWNGKISLPLVYARAIVTLPLTLASVLKIALLILRKKPRALVTDFEGHGVYAALLVRRVHRMPIIEFDNFAIMRAARLPFGLSSDEERARKAWAKSTRAVVPFADHVVVQTPIPGGIDEPGAVCTPPPIRDAFGQYRGPLATDGPIVVSLGSVGSSTRAGAQLEATLGATGLSFIVFGWPEHRQAGRVQFHTFDEAAYLRALARAPFAIVAANTSALDALALKKPVLIHPTPGMFEQTFSARMFEWLGVGEMVAQLTPAAVLAFAERHAQLATRVAAASFFDNARAFATLDRLIDAPVPAEPALR